MRASRLISLVLLLQAGGTMTAAALAEALEVSERTVYRDVLALSAAGVPVYAEQGRAGGYRLLDGYRTRLTGLSRAEAEALFLAGLPGPARDLGLGDALHAARLKVAAALPAPWRDAARERFHLDVPGWFRDADEPPAALATLARAVWDDRVATIGYRRERPVTRTVEPWGLVLKGGIWYLAAAHEGAGRVYRVDRVTGVEVTGERFERPAGFDLAAFWDRHAEAFQRAVLAERITVRLTPAGLRQLRFAVESVAVRDAVHGPPDADGRVVVRLPVENADVAYTQLLCLGPEAEVLEPETLRQRMREAADRMVARYR